MGGTQATPSLDPIDVLAALANKQPSTQAAPPTDDPLEQLAKVGQPNQRQSPTDTASDTRQMLVSGLTGMPTPNMSDADRASFQRGKAVGALSVPVVAGATLGATAAPEVVPTIVQKAKDVAEWAKANPIKSLALAKMADELGIHPFDLLHSAVKYGKNLFGTSEDK